MKTKPSHALAHLRQICCSGLSREIAITEFLRSVPMLISSNSNTFSISDSSLQPIYHLSGFDLSDMAEVAPDIIADYHTPERQKRAIAWFSRHPIISDPRVMDESFYLTDMYNLIYRQFDMHHLLWVPIKLDAEKTGILGLYRQHSQKPFDNNDKAQLMQLLRYVVHAYRAVSDVCIEFSQSGLSGMMILNAEGTILYQCPEAKRLLEQVRYPRLLTDLRKQDRLMLKLAELCNNLRRIYRGQDAPPPSLLHTNLNGQFLFRAYWLDGSNCEAEGLIGVTIEHHQPLTQRILRAMRDLPLSPTQREVAFLLAQGLPFEQIGLRLHIKQTTVKDHVNKIYTKLDIHQRGELLPKLLAVT